jgi:DNA-binding NarL/FixJ family response regulator
MVPSAFRDQGFPCAILKSGNSPLKALIRYLHDDRGLRFCEISRVVFRKHNTVMTSFASSEAQPPPEASPQIPFSLLSKLTVFEAAVNHLHTEGESCASIARMLGKRPSEIHTVLRRSQEKFPPEIAKKKLQETSPKSIPVAVFSGSLAPLQSLVGYLFYDARLSVGKIAHLIGRSSSTVSISLKTCSLKGKLCGRIDTHERIPLAIFHDRSLTVGEHLVFYLLKEGKSRGEVAQLLNRNYQTVSTLANRAASKGVRR